MVVSGAVRVVLCNNLVLVRKSLAQQSTPEVLLWRGSRFACREHRLLELPGALCRALARCPDRGSCLCPCQGSAGADRASPQAAVVHTTETIRLRYFMDLLMEQQRPVMLVGNAGTGKSVLMWDKLEALGTDEYLVQSVPLNFYTTSAMLQGKAHRASIWPHTGLCCRVLQC